MVMQSHRQATARDIHYGDYDVQSPNSEFLSTSHTCPAKSVPGQFLDACEEVHVCA
jgi:hypothetical protein